MAAIRLIFYFSGSFNLKTIVNELSPVKYKSTKLGVQFGVPTYKIKEFDKDDDPLTSIVDYWLRGNVKNGPSRNWESIVSILRSRHVDESGLADKISRKYCLNAAATANNTASKSSLPEECSVFTCCLLCRL